ncbi:MAG TPA: pyridoxamine 5'-phosphate oxidase family protein [Oleiagrimonas sp.]|nr:pyridoxamine 5'-phosphate oxidase family protein [Oleiagrimonas sp.]
MKIETGNNDSLRKLGELINDSEVAMLTTHAADGSMVSRPLQTLKLDAEGELVFFTAANSPKVEELTDASDVNLAYADHANKRYVSVRGRTRIDRDRDTIDELWSSVQKVFFPEGRNDPNLAVLHVRVRDASYWEAADNFALRALEFSRAVLSKEPSDLGKQGHIDPNR